MNQLRQQIVTKPKVKAYSKITFAKLVKLAYGIRVSKKYTAMLALLFWSIVSAAQTPPVRSMIVNLNLLNNNGSTQAADGLRNDYSTRFSNDIDQFDNIKLININETFGSMRGSVFLATERRNEIVNTDTIFVRFLKSSQRNYQLELYTINFASSGTQVELHDQATNTRINLPIDQVYLHNFSITANASTQSPDRFRIYFRHLSIGSGPVPVRFVGLQGKRSALGVELNWQVAEQVNVASYQVERSSTGQLFEVIDRIPAQTAGSSFQYSALDRASLSGVQFYRIRSVDLDGRSQLSDVIRVVPAKAALASLMVFPNPAPASQLQVQVTLPQASLVQWRLVDANGRVAFQQQVSLPAGTQVLRPQVNNAVKSGLFQVQVVVPDQPMLQQTVMLSWK
jgi:hypothetical protein